MTDEVEAGSRRRAGPIWPWAVVGAAAMTAAIVWWSRFPVSPVQGDGPEPAADSFIPMPARPTGLTPYDLAKLRGLGLAQPEQDLLRDLARHPELIPQPAVLGGQMRFVLEESEVLTGRWVMATYEDGHVRGRLLLAYQVASGGVISWQVLSAVSGE